MDKKSQEQSTEAQTMVPERFVPPLQVHLARVKVIYELEARYNIRTVQELLGHADVSTTMI